MCVRVCIYLYTYNVTHTTSAPKNHLLIRQRFYSRKGSDLTTTLERVDGRDRKALSHRSVVFHLRSEELCGLAKARREWHLETRDEDEEEKREQPNWSV